MPNLIDATPDYVSLANGKFDTRFRYVRRINSASPVNISTGANWSLGDAPLYNRFPRSDGGPANSVAPIDVSDTTGAGAGSLDISPTTGIVLRDPTTGRLLFDSNNPIMHIVNNNIEGSRVFPSPNATGAGVNINTLTAIANIDPAATHIIGSVRTAYTLAQATSMTGSNPNDWWSTNGSFVIYQEWGELGTGNAAGQVISDKAFQVVAQSILEFIASNGQLLLNERTFIRPLFNGGQWNPVSGGAVANYVRQDFTLFWKLKAVVFS